MAQHESALWRVDLEIRLALRSALLSKEIVLAAPLLGLQPDLDEEAMFAAWPEPGPLDFELHLLQRGRQVLVPTRRQCREGHFLDGSPRHLEGVVACHGAFARADADKGQVRGQRTGELERHRARRKPGDRIVNDEQMREPVPERELDVPRDAVAIEAQASTAESRRLQSHAAAGAADLSGAAGQVQVETTRDLVRLGETEVGRRSARTLFEGE